MEAPRGIRLERSLGATGRGTLWRATREPGGPRIVRFIGQQFTDGQFKQSLAVLRQREHPRMAPIAGLGYSGPHYYLEYEVDADCETLEQRMKALPHWRDRLLLLREVCEVLPQWLAGPVRPLGLNMRDIVVRRIGGRWHPWLLPCPPVAQDSPRDLLGLDRHVLATIAPEAIRGVGLDPRAQDWYALGTLAALAAGCAPGEPTGDDAVTDQARNTLLRPAAGRSELPSYLDGADEVRGLFAAVQRYRYADPGARPADAGALTAALDAVTDVLALAAGRRGHPGQAVEMLSWMRPGEGASYLSGLVLAAELSLELGDPARARDLTGELLDVMPGYLPAVRLRAEALWQLAPETQEAGRELSAALVLLKQDPEAGAMPFRRAAELYRRWGNPARAADELYEACEADWSDFESLLLYRECWLEMGDQQNAGAVSAEAHHRVDRMKNVLTEAEVKWWHEAFDRPLS